MKHLPSDFRWSFSKLASFKQCPMSFYLQYVSNPGNDDELPGYFSQYGTLMHSILEQYYKDELPEFCLADEWRDRYESEVTITPPPFPAGFGEKNYNCAVEYLEHFQGLPEGYTVVSVEKKFVIELGGYRVSGIADLVVRDSSGNIEVWDHKTKSDASMKKEYQLYRKQLYLYAIWIHGEYGVWPSKLCFNMVKSGRMIEEQFDLSLVKETIDWFVDTIHEVEACDVLENWETCISDGERKEPYFCRWICGCNPSCDRYQEVHQIAYADYLEKKALESDMMGGMV